jgi:hypothetical protein
MKSTFLFEPAAEFLIATFGKAELVRSPSGKCELRGGNLSDYQEAKEWCSLFMPEVVIWRN